MDIKTQKRNAVKKSSGFPLIPRRNQCDLSDDWPCLVRSSECVSEREGSGQFDLAVRPGHEPWCNHLCANCGPIEAGVFTSAVPIVPRPSFSLVRARAWVRLLCMVMAYYFPCPGDYVYLRCPVCVYLQYLYWNTSQSRACHYFTWFPTWKLPVRNLILFLSSWSENHNFVVYTASHGCNHPLFLLNSTIASDWWWDYPLTV